jgi:HEAT repeat protein
MNLRNGIFLAAAICLTGVGFAEEDEPLVAEKPLSHWLKQLRSDNRGFQIRAAQTLVKAPAELHPKIVPQLIPLLKSDRENDRFVAAQALGEYGPTAKAAVPDLLPMLDGTQFERNRAAAAKALGQILKDAQPSEEIEKIAQALTRKFNEDYDKYPDVRRESARALGMIGPAAKSCIPKLLRGLTDFVEHSPDHFSVRMAAAWAAGRMGPDSAGYLDRLISMLHGEIDIATAVVWAIGEIGPINDNVVPNLLNRMEKALYGQFGGFRVGPYNYIVGEITEGTVQEYLDFCFANLAKFGAKSKPAVPLMNRLISEDGFGDAHRIRNSIGAMKVLRAVGPEAADALPALEKAVKITRFDQRIPAATVEVFKKEAAAALAAVKGEAVPMEKKDIK